MQVKGDTIFNQVDNNGLKQGFWKAKYNNGNVKYTGYFKNDKPVGEFKRYFENSKLKALMYFSDIGENTKAKLFYENGKLAAQGTYWESQKDSIWKYYSYYNGCLTYEESYIKGGKNGISRKYYNNGTISEETDWQDDLRNGVWKQYFENGNLKLETSHHQNKREGDFKLYYPTEKIEINGAYLDDKMHGTWSYYDEQGNLKFEIEYINGIAKNADELIRQEQEMFRLIEQNKGKFQEPIETIYNLKKKNEPADLH